MEDAHICQPFLFAEEHNGGGANNSNNTNEVGGDGGEQQQSSSDSKMADASLNNNSSKWTRIPVPGHSLYAVFDGHGGTFAAEYAGLNLCRVLSRHFEFVEYARHSQRMAAEDGDGMEDGGDEKDKNGTSSKEKGEKTEAQRQLDHRTGLDLLESALRDAFVALDREILMQVRGLDVPDANAPYGDDFDDHHSHGQLHKDHSGGNGGGGAQDDVEAMAELQVEDDADPSNPHPTHTPAKSSSPVGSGHPGPARPPDYEDSGTTAIVVVLTPTSLVCANAGDSRAVYAKNGAKVVPLSYDHKPDDEDEERRIREAGGYVSGGRVEGDLAVNRGLGDFRFKEEATVMKGVRGNGNFFCSGSGDEDAEGGVGTGTGNEIETSISPNSSPRTMIVPATPGDQKVSTIPDIIVQSRHPTQDEFVVVACDGIWDVQTNLECVRMVSELFEEGEEDMGLVCEECLDICLRRGSKDNMTVLVVKLESQSIGEGGGVAARRERREAEAKAAAASNDERKRKTQDGWG